MLRNNAALFVLIIASLLVACAPSPAVIPTASIVPSPTGAPSIPTIIPTSSPAAVPTTTQPPAPTVTLAPRLCSPLQGIGLSEIAGLISNPFHPPAPGLDDPHQGIDLALKIPGSQAAAAGNPVLAALSGQVAMVTTDRFPFGNAVIIETPLDTLPVDWWATADVPTPAPTLPLRSALTCPAAPAPVIPDPARRSLYVLYAHLEHPANLQPGDPVSCGEAFGQVGMSGNALNPHLHFEAKVGPSGLQIASMAHYDASATAAEMSSYCLWSISGLFQVVDPNKVLQLTP